MKVLIGLGLITLAFGAYHHSEKELKFTCLNDKSESNCIAGSYPSACGTTKCYRIPGQSCRRVEKLAQLYGMTCHPNLICNKCGQCVGTIVSNSVPITNAGTCLPELSKRNYPYNFQRSRYIDSNEVQFYPIPSPNDI